MSNLLLGAFFRCQELLISYMLCMLMFATKNKVERKPAVGYKMQNTFIKQNAVLICLTSLRLQNDCIRWKIHVILVSDLDGSNNHLERHFFPESHVLCLF